MKMVKSLLLGTAAGLVAVAGAQAADKPVKAPAAPVLYVKICTLYGDGYYYVPGTNTCLKLGGYVRVQSEYNAGGGGVPDGWPIGGQQLQAMYDRVRTNDVDFRVRGALSLDVRDQTDYGTLRSYFRIGINQTTPTDAQGGAVFWDRAFIQWAGFTIGKAQSFYDTVTYGGAYTYHNVRTVSDTGASGWNVWAYTAHFGNGLSGTVSLEDPNRDHRVIDNTCAVRLRSHLRIISGQWPPRADRHQHRHARARLHRQSARRSELGLCGPRPGGAQRQRCVFRRL